MYEVAPLNITKAFSCMNKATQLVTHITTQLCPSQFAKQICLNEGWGPNIWVSVRDCLILHISNLSRGLKSKIQRYSLLTTKYLLGFSLEG